MLENIHIQNFRCFEDFKADGFERINLIGGKNNSGKSCLLEAILCLNSKAFSYSDNVYGLREQEVKDLLIEKLDFGKIIISSKIVFDNEVSLLEMNYEFKEGGQSSSFPFFIDVLYVKGNKFCPSYSSYSGLDRLEKKDQQDIYIEIFNIVDKNINKLRTIGATGYHPQIKESQNSKFISLKSQGDAVKYLFNYFMPFFLRKTNIESRQEPFIILIDEIENGLHYTAHYDFWKKLFQLSKSENVQVFATTHSLEMIQAFNKVAKEEGEGAYFEMVRNEQTNDISAIKHSTSILDEELENELPIRGEIYKEKIILSSKLIDTLNKAVQNAQKNLKDKDIPIPFIRDGWIWQTLADGTEEKLEQLEPILEK